ncbi:MAG: shikimate kinase [Alphaproteobacteria bacterium]
MLKKDTLKICIIGMPGSGKSTIGRILSEKINYKFFDTDKNIEDETKSKINDIFTNKGEAHFRELETKVLIKLIKINKVVISTGGGIILRNKNILNKCFNIYLQCDEDVLVKRASRNKDRPLLLIDIKKNMKNLFNERKDIYNDLADLKINTESNTQKTITEILNKLPI